MDIKIKVDEIEQKYSEGDFVVYPAHGVGHVLGMEKQEIAGTLLELVKVRFDHDRMTLRIPLNKAASSGLRKLSSRKQMDAAFTTLRGRAKVRKSMWSRRAQEYETKINSGNLIWIAEGVRDLHRGENQGDQSYSERQMYQAALERLAGEFAAIEDMDKSSATIKIEGMMSAA
jgi:CarD family transcriptional regulator